MKTDSGRTQFTLEPLRTDGPEALCTDNLPGIERIRLLLLEVAWENEFLAVTIRQAEDLFGCAAAEEKELIPRGGRLARAIFGFDFAQAAEPVLVELRPPDSLRLGPGGNAALIERWLRERGFAGTTHEPFGLAKS